jgi:hypothetical protein
MKPPRDEDGIPLKDGDYITFTFGIPPICVTARVSAGEKDWTVTCIHPADVKPKTTPLRELTRYYQIWKASPERVRGATRTMAGGET